MRVVYSGTARVRTTREIFKRALIGAQRAVIGAPISNHEKVSVRHVLVKGPTRVILLLLSVK
jgi:hypothetical protein